MICPRCWRPALVDTGYYSNGYTCPPCAFTFSQMECYSFNMLVIAFNEKQRFSMVVPLVRLKEDGTFQEFPEDKGGVFPWARFKWEREYKTQR